MRIGEIEKVVKKAVEAESIRGSLRLSNSKAFFSVVKILRGLFGMPGTLFNSHRIHSIKLQYMNNFKGKLDKKSYHEASFDQFVG